MSAASSFSMTAPVLEVSPVSPDRRSRPTNGQNPRNFKFERADWTLFRSISTLPQKAGVPACRLRRLVLKELADNALDAGGEVEVGEIDGGGYFVEDDGPGIDPDEIATLFSIDRPMVSTKLLRLPTRGALGNGLRVVAGAVLASSGRLVVYTRDRRIEVTPHDDGTTTTDIEVIDFPVGTRVEIWFGQAMPKDEDALDWAKLATRISHAGSIYKGKTSPHWYDPDTLFELLQAAGDRLVYDLVAEFDGCSGAKAGRIAAEFKNTACVDVDRAGARKLLEAARENARVVKPSRLGSVGPDAALEPHHAKIEDNFLSGGTIEDYFLSGDTMSARIPFVVEAWADAEGIDDTVGDFMVNRTPITGVVSTFHEKSKLTIHGCGLYSVIIIDVGRRNFYFTINVTTPYCPYTTDGKEPDLSPFAGAIAQAVKKAVKKAGRAAPKVWDHSDSLLPRARPGRRSADEKTRYQEQLEGFRQRILELRPALDFAPSSRGWCYILEEHGLTKGEFNKAQDLINDFRKSGDLPVDIASEDVARRFEDVEEVDELDPEEKAIDLIGHLRRAHLCYAPISFWDDQEVYIQMMVEKIDLKHLFRPVTQDFHIPVANARGWSDLHSRASMMTRFARWEAEGKQCVLLYCGDHDPAGLQISDTLRSNMEDMAGAVGWRPDDLIIDRFGLNADFIEEHGLTWIDNLETGSGASLDDPKHRDHKKPYVQNYIHEYGVRKVEANVLVVRPDAGRELCRQAIHQYLSGDAPVDYERKLEPHRVEVQSEIQRLLQEKDL